MKQNDRRGSDPRCRTNMNMRTMWNRKFQRSGGFTLVEMLIVVAIIAILIAISIPMIHQALERARHSTDAANERAAKAAILAEYLMGDGVKIKINEIKTYYYDAAKGDFGDKIYASYDGEGNPIESSRIAPYGKHGNTGKFLAMVVSGGEVYMEWVDTAKSADLVVGTGNAKLCSSDESVSHN